jgi:putative addiction module component (TIGR02574 family)
MNAEFAPLFELSCAERLRLVEDLWDSIAKEADQIPVPDWQIEEVERIRVKAEQNPASLESWVIGLRLPQRPKTSWPKRSNGTNPSKWVWARVFACLPGLLRTCAEASRDFSRGEGRSEGIAEKVSIYLLLQV